MKRESATKLLDAITVARRLENSGGEEANFKATMLKLQRELANFRVDFEKQKTFLGQYGNELVSILSNEMTVCDKVVLLTDMNQNSDPRAMVSMLFEAGGISHVETMLKALFQKLS